MSEQDELPNRFVIYRGARMIEGWPEKIREAQTVTHYDIGGVDFERIRTAMNRMIGARTNTLVMTAV